MFRFILVVAAALAAAAAMASTDSTAVTQNVAQEKSVMDQLYINYFSYYYAGSLNNPFSAQLNDRKGKLLPPSAQGSRFDSTLVAGYRLSKDVYVGPELNFLFEPVLGHGFTLNDSGARIADNHFIRIGRLNVYNNLIIQAPTSQYSRDRGLYLGVKSTPIISYPIADTPITVGAFTELKAYLGADYGKAFKMYAEPYMFYALSDKFSLSLMYEMEADHIARHPGMELSNAGTDLEPGFKWNITKKIWINPYLILYTGEKVTTDSTSVNATMSITL